MSRRNRWIVGVGVVLLGAGIASAAAALKPARVVLTVQTERSNSNDEGCAYSVRARLTGGWPWTTAEWVSGKELRALNGWVQYEEVLSAEDVLDFWGSNRIGRGPSVENQVLGGVGIGLNEHQYTFRYRLHGGELGSSRVSIWCEGVPAQAIEPADHTSFGVNEPKRDAIPAPLDTLLVGGYARGPFREALGVIASDLSVTERAMVARHLDIIYEGKLRREGLGDGGRLKVVYERMREPDGRLSSIQVLAAQAAVGGELHTRFFYAHGNQPGYYDDAGEAGSETVRSDSTWHSERHALGRLLALTPTSRASSTRSSPPSTGASRPRSTHPPGASAVCRDGTYSYSRQRSGTCSWHGGVRRWL